MKWRGAPGEDFPWTRLRRALKVMGPMRLARLFVLCLLCLPLVHRAAPMNVLLIMSDDLTACLSCYGNATCRTPNLDRLAREGVLFERAYCQYPVCGPSRASFMSGLYPNATKLTGNQKQVGSYKLSNKQLANHPSIGEFLRKNGYFSARVGKIYHMGIPGGVEIGEPGGDEPDSWDYAYNVLAPETFSPGKHELLSPKRAHMGSNFSRLIVPDEQIATQHDVLAAQQAIAIMENRQKSAPDKGFFLAVGFVRPHVPLVAPKRLFDQYPPEKMKLPHVPEGDLDDVPKPAAAMDNMPRYGMNEEQQRQAMAGYYASVSFMDEQVGKVLAALERLDLRKNTIVVFSSDHGYNLGEHHCWQKLSLFEESTRVPFIISAPGFAAGKKASGIIEMLDLYPTLADLLDLKDKAPSILQGQSLRPLLENPERRDWSKTHAYTITHLQGESIRTARWRYNRWGKEGEELYDHETDPQEYTNLAKKPEHAKTLEEMRALLDAARKRSLSAPGAAESGGAAGAGAAKKKKKSA
jgi:choline-sulfatase